MMNRSNFKLSMSPQNSFRHMIPEVADQTNKFYNKKRVGDYAYYLADLIGSGYSSQVYKCHHREQRNNLYAIKVIKLSRMTKGNYQLLQNQIKILQKLNHPNIIKFHHVYYTQNNCYIITDYCEGGTLQDQIDKDKMIDWESVISQLISGCNYLSQNLIIHRDIKPANIFLKNGEWKIGDFGFARYIYSKDALVKEMYKIGSPFYMPPETLINSIYSLKTDSFALGVLFFYIVVKKYPWPGSNRKELLEFYDTKPLPIHLISHLPNNYQDIIVSLCKTNINQRALISDLNVTAPESMKKSFCFARCLTISTNVAERSDSTIQSPQDSNEDLRTIFQQITELDIIQRMKLCKFINYINKNTEKKEHFDKMNVQLKKLLKLLVVLFDWVIKDGFQKYIQEFNCQNNEPLEKLTEFRTLQQNIQNQIRNLNMNQDRFEQNLRIKMIQLKHILNLIIKNEIKKTKQYLGKLILHPDFSKIYISPNLRQEIEKLMI